ncbi:MAG TPA: YncE family protein [Mycobacterium sp.]|nr:YncE family protein [Mycobacterium sp.]HTX97309.1 YncE family protein [Mycobacterium sp.]
MSEVNGRKAAHNDREDRVFGLDNTSVLHIPVKNGPISDIGISPDGSRLIVTNYGRDTVSVIDTHTYRVSTTGLHEPFAVAVSDGVPTRAYLSTASRAYDTVDVIDVASNTRIATYPLALSVSDVTVNADGSRVYVTRNGSRGADVAVLDTSKDQVQVVELATGPGATAECVRISPDGGRLYVGVNRPWGGHLAVVETRARPRGGRFPIVATIELGLRVRDVALSDDGATAYVAGCGPVVGAVLDVVDTRANKITSTRKISEIAGPLTRLALSSDGSRAYLVSDDRITVLCTRTQDVIGDVGVVRHPSCAVESPDGRYLYIADYSGVITVAPVASSTRLLPAALAANC